MKKITFILFLNLLFIKSVYSQNTSVSATITDVGGQAWVLGTYKIDFVPSPRFQGVYRQNGVPFTPVSITGNLDATGSFSSVLVPDNNQITPVGTQWAFTVCPQATAVCFTAAPIVITGGSQTVTSNVIPPAISVQCSPTTRAYVDAEVGCSQGGYYFSLTLNQIRICTASVGNFCSTWSTNAGTAGAAGSPPQTQINDPGSPGVLGGTPCQTFPSKTLGPVNNNCDTHYKGPNPYVDITAFGARACNPNATPCAAGLTATISLGSPTTATISSASTFVNGDGVMVTGAGPLNSLSTPAAPTVTNVLANGGTGTGAVVSSAAGATTKCYKVVAADIGGGLTAASPETCTSTSQATLGAVTVNVTSFSRSGTTVTVTTAAAHPCLVGTGGGEVFIGGGNGISDPSFRGWYTIATCADSTHFTWTNPVVSTVNGASTSATGGTATFYPANHVVVSQVTGAWQYVFYCGASGAETKCGVGNPQGANTDLTWDDFTNLQTNWQFFPWIPNTPPGSATADNLSTTITTGAGTTTLTLANAATTAVTTATILLDAAPAILAAGQNFRIPLDPNGNSFVVNSFVDLRSQAGTSIEQAGKLMLNETLAVNNVRWNGVSNAPMTAGGPGGWSAGKPSVSVFGGARPGVYVQNNSLQGPDVRGLNWSGCSGTNGCLLMLVEGGFSMNFDTLDFSTGTTSNDLMGIGLYCRGSAGQSCASIVLDKVSFSPGNTTDGASHNGGFVCNFCGDVWIRSAYTVHRGMLFSPASSGQLRIDSFHYNGGGTPFITTFTGEGNQISIRIGAHVILDTMAHPCLSALGGNTVFTNFDVGCQPSSGVTSITGAGIALVGGPAIPQGVSSLLSGVQVPGLVSFNSAQSVWLRNDGPISAESANGTVYVEGPTPATPTATLSAGGSLATGHTYSGLVTAVWAGNYEGAPSATSNVVTATGGNQTVTITGSVVTPTPKCYNIYISQDGGGPGTRGGGCQPTPTFTYTSLGGANQVLGAIAQGGPTMLMPGTQGIASGGPIVAPANVDDGTQLRAKRFTANGSAPTCTVSVGAGTGATCSLSGNSTDNMGQMQINTGTGPGAAGTITITFSSPFPVNVSCPVGMLANATNSWNARATIIGTSTCSGTTYVFNWDNNAVNLPASTSNAVAVNYTVIGH